MAVKSPYESVEIPEIGVTQFVLQQAHELGDKPAIIDGPTGRTLTYTQLAQRVRSFAAGLAE